MTVQCGVIATWQCSRHLGIKCLVCYICAICNVLAKTKALATVQHTCNCADGIHSAMTHNIMFCRIPTSRSRASLHAAVEGLFR